jgi:hypothetical protein
MATFTHLSHSISIISTNLNLIFEVSFSFVGPSSHECRWDNHSWALAVARIRKGYPSVFRRSFVSCQ